MCKRIMIGRALWRGLVLALLATVQPALAQEIETGSGVICDTAEQAERYIALFKGSTHETVRQVNIEAKSNSACGVISVAYLRGNDVSKAANAQGTYIVARILVVGRVTPHGVLNITPVVQFTVFKIDERVA